MALFHRQKKCTFFRYKPTRRNIESVAVVAEKAKTQFLRQAVEY